PEFDRRAELFPHLDIATQVAYFKAISPDEQADLVRELRDADRAGLLVSLGRARRRGVAKLLDYPLGSAGRVMTTTYVIAGELAGRADARAHPQRRRRAAACLCGVRRGSRRAPADSRRVAPGARHLRPSRSSHRRRDAPTDLERHPSDGPRGRGA